MSEIDWTTTEGCVRCNEHGPFPPRGWLIDLEASRDAHQAWHAVVAGVMTAIAPVVKWLAKVLA